MAIIRIRTSPLVAVVACVITALPVPAVRAADAQAEIERTLAHQQQAVERNQQKLDQSLRKSESERKRLLARQERHMQRQMERDALRAKRP